MSYKEKRGRERDESSFPRKTGGGCSGGLGEGRGWVNGGSCQALRWEDRSRGSGEQGWGVQH